jgi:hypothetical protein
VKTGKNWTAFGADRGSDDHAIRFDAAKFTRCEIGDDGDFAADERFRLVILRNTGANLANFRSDVHGKLEQLVGANDAFGRFDLPHAHFDFGEILNADFFADRSRGGTR